MVYAELMNLKFPTLIMVWTLTGENDSSSLVTMWAHGSSLWRRLWRKGHTYRGMFA